MIELLGKDKLIALEILKEIRNNVCDECKVIIDDFVLRIALK